MRQVVKWCRMGCRRCRMTPENGQKHTSHHQKVAFLADSPAFNKKVANSRESTSLANAPGVGANCSRGWSVSLQALNRLLGSPYSAVVMAFCCRQTIGSPSGFFTKMCSLRLSKGCFCLFLGVILHHPTPSYTHPTPLNTLLISDLLLGVGSVGKN